MQDLASAPADPRVANPMASLKDKTAKSAVPKLDGMEVVGSKDFTALYFGPTKINNNLDLVAAVSKEDGGRVDDDILREERG